MPKLKKPPTDAELAAYGWTAFATSIVTVLNVGLGAPVLLSAHDTMSAVAGAALIGANIVVVAHVMWRGFKLFNT